LALAREDLGGILADEMGLGKTVQIIAALLDHRRDRGPHLIIGPATILENWNRELRKFAPSLNVLVHHGADRTGFPSEMIGYDVVVSSYDLVVRDLALFKMINWTLVVLDEAQAIKNAGTLRTRSVKQLLRKCGLAVSGTPVENRLEDLWSLLDFACPGHLGTLAEFQLMFENTTDGAWALRPSVSPLILRRTIAEVAQDLPERIDIPVAIRLSRESAMKYEALRQSILAQYSTAAGLVALTKLRQFCAHPFVVESCVDDPAAHSTKYARLVEIIDEIVVAREKAIVFTSFLEMSDILSRDLSARFQIECSSIDGRTPVGARQGMIDRFTELRESAILILNPKAAGTGLNIVAANHVIHYNLEWNPAVEDQASARAHRRGQERPVTVHRLFHTGTVEELIDQRVALKRALAAGAVAPTGDIPELDQVVRALMYSPLLEGH
jgi:SNF2 family DNA or RNA helicase